MNNSAELNSLNSLKILLMRCQEIDKLATRDTAPILQFNMPCLLY